MPDGTRNNQGSFYAHHSSSSPMRYFKNRNYPSMITVAKGVMKGIVLLSPGTMIISYKHFYGILLIH